MNYENLKRIMEILTQERERKRERKKKEKDSFLSKRTLEKNIGKKMWEKDRQQKIVRNIKSTSL